VIIGFVHVSIFL